MDIISTSSSRFKLSIQYSYYLSVITLEDLANLSIVPSFCILLSYEEAHISSSKLGSKLGIIDSMYCKSIKRAYRKVFREYCMYDIKEIA